MLIYTDFTTKRTKTQGVFPIGIPHGPEADICDKLTMASIRGIVTAAWVRPEGWDLVLNFIKMNEA